MIIGMISKKSGEPSRTPAPKVAHAKSPKSSEMKALVCRRLKVAGDAFNRNQSELARLLGVDPRQLNGYYREKNYPDEAFLVRFCQLTGCTMDWIFRGIVESSIPIETAIHIALSAPELIAPPAERAGGEPARRDERESERAA